MPASSPSNPNGLLLTRSEPDTLLPIFPAGSQEDGSLSALSADP